MDVAHLAQLMFYGAIVLVIVRSIVTTVGHAEHGVVNLFASPDRTLGWPHGVQEGDEPWAWRAPTADPGPSRDVSPPADPGGRGAPELFAIEERRGALVVPVAPVDPIRFNVRPHSHRSRSARLVDLHRQL